MSSIESDLHRIHARSATFREHSADARAVLAGRLRETLADERVMLETCHRVELVTVGGEPDHSVPSASGRDAVRRVFEVVAGLDSAVIAEEQLLGQARSAYESALAEGATGPILNELFRRALRFGRRVRSHAQPGTYRSLADPGVDWLLDRLPAASAVTVCGTGDMGRRIGAALAGAGHRLTVVSSSPERGAALVAACEGTGHRVRTSPIDHDLVAASDAIVLAVRSDRPALAADLLVGSRLPWVLDLSSPPSVRADAAGQLGERLLDLDRLAGMGGAARSLPPTTERRLRAEMEAEVDAFGTWLEGRRSADAQSVLFAAADAVRQRHLGRLRRRGTLDAEQMAAVETASAAMVGELLHGPSVQLRRGGADAATVRRLFGIDR